MLKKHLKMYILLHTDKNCDLLRERPVLSTGETPHDIQNYNRNMVTCPGGAQRQD